MDKIDVRFCLVVSLLLLPMMTFSIHYVFVVNFATPLWIDFSEGNETLKIRGLGCHPPSGLLQTPELARSTGANWYHIKMCVRFSKDGNYVDFPTQDIWIRNQIRRAHRVGLKVLLVPFVASVEYPSMPGNITLPRSVWERFYECATKLTLKAARMAAEEHVEMLATANEVWSYTSYEEASRWYQFILPKIREIYNGKVMICFYPQLHNLFQDIEEGIKRDEEFERILAINVSGYDFIGLAGTPPISSIEEMHELNGKVILKLREIYEKWGVRVIFLEVNAPETIEEQRFWKYYLSKGMSRSQIRAMVFREWVKDFKDVDFVDGWFFIEWTPNSFLTFFGREPNEKYIFGWQTDEVYKAIKEIYGG